MGDFYNTIGISEYWDSEDALQAAMNTGYYQAMVFSFLFTNLVICLILAMSTSPGTIPSNLEWDMPA